MSAATGTNGFQLEGSAQAETLTGSAKADSIDGNAGADKISGGTAGNDSLTGAAGNDSFVVASTGDVTISDLATGDVLTVASTTGSLTASSADGFTAAAADGNSKSLADVAIYVTATAKNIDITLATTSFGFTIKGDHADTDGDEDNVLKGSSKADVLQGYAGTDDLTGNGGSDLFDFSNTYDGIVQDVGTDVEAKGALAAGDIIGFASGAQPDAVKDWTDGADTFDTGSTANFTLLEVGDDVEALSIGNNYGLRGAINGNGDFVMAAAGADVLAFKAAHADITNSGNLFFEIEAAAGNLAAVDFV
jgi:hypothetical protein